MSDGEARDDLGGYTQNAKMASTLPTSCTFIHNAEKTLQISRQTIACEVRSFVRTLDG